MASSQTLVLDLDETLISSVTDGSPPVGDYYLLASNCWCRKRPYLDEFLAYAGRRFDDIGLWSAGRKSYVDSVVNALDLPFEPAFVCHREHCDQVDVQEIGSDGRRQLVQTIRKPLQVIFEEHPGFTRYNCWVLDDRKDYASENLLNWLSIPPWAPGAKPVPEPDDYLLRLVQWFELPEVKYAVNVLEVPKTWY